MAKSRANLKVIASPPRKAGAVARARAAPVVLPPGSTQRIVDAITTAIVERRLMPGTKLAEQQIAHAALAPLRRALRHRAFFPHLQQQIEHAADSEKQLIDNEKLQLGAQCRGVGRIAAGVGK